MTIELFGDLEFARSWVWLILPLPLLVLFLPRISINETSTAIRFPHFQTLRTLESSRISIAETFSIILLSFSWLFFVGAAADPERLLRKVEEPVKARDIMLALDISRSMETSDMIVQGRALPRIAIVKYIVTDFIERRTADRIGLVLFGSNAYLQSPLTFDGETVKKYLADAHIGLTGPSTAIGDALALSVKRLKEVENDDKIVILLTDGSNQAGNFQPMEAALLARDAGIKVYTIAVGSRRSRDIDERSLLAIAQTTQGDFFRATDPEQLKQIYQRIDELEAVVQDPMVFRQMQKLYLWPTSLGMFFLIAALLIRRKRL